MRTVVSHFLFVLCDVYLVPNQTITVQNGTNFREIQNKLRDLLSVMMSCYEVIYVLTGLERHCNHTSYYACILQYNF